MKSTATSHVRKRPSGPSTCKSCTNCRARKTRCDGAQPQCRTCIQTGRPCRYPEDTRKGARASKAELLSLQAEIAWLKQLIPGSQDGSSVLSRGLRDLYQQAPNTLERSYMMTAGSTGHSETPHRDADVSSQTQVAVSPGNESARHVEGGEHSFPGRRQCKNSGIPRRLSNNWDPLPSPSLSSPRDRRQQAQGQLDDIEENDNVHGAATPRRQEAIGLSPSESNVAGAVERNGRIEVHGITSILHDPVKRPSSPKPKPREKRLPYQQIRDHLVANAALQRHQEHMILQATVPSAQPDLDGLDPETAKHLLDLHWNRQHLAYLISYRPAIIESLSNGGPYANRVLLNGIYYSSALYSDREIFLDELDDPNSMRSRFYARFQQHLSSEIVRPSIPTAVGLLLMGSSLVSDGRQSAGWVLCGIAYRMILDLGCHLSMPVQRSRQGAGGLTTTEFEIRTRLYWGAFVTDKYQSLYLGRAPALQPEESRVSPEFLDEYEEYEPWSPYVDSQTKSCSPPAYTPKPTYALSTFELHVKLSEITHDIINAFYSLQSVNRSAEHLLSAKTAIEKRLEDFENRIPSHLRFDPSRDETPPPHQITPHTTYNTLIILLHRPFLPSGHLSQRCLSPALETSGQRKCLAAAMNIKHMVKAYQSAFTLRRAPYLLSYATYSAVLVAVNHNPQGDDFDTTNGELVETIRFLWSCLLDLRNGCNFGLRKPLAILEKLVSRYGARLPELSTRETVPRHQMAAGAGDSEGHTNGDDVCNSSDRERRVIQRNTAGWSQQRADQQDDQLYDSWPAWPSDDIVGGFDGLGVLEDSLFGLFSPSHMDISAAW